MECRLALSNIVGQPPVACAALAPAEDWWSRK